MIKSRQHLRRSQRVTASKACDIISEGFSTPADSEDHHQPVDKRQKTSSVVDNATANARPASRRRRGKLQDLPEMPLDILFEIFEYLFPLDILRLARTSKALRDVLLRRSARSIWRATFHNLPIQSPPRPEDLTEPRWASLLFDTHCSVSLFRCISFPPTQYVVCSVSFAQALSSLWFCGCSAFGAARSASTQSFVTGTQSHSILVYVDVYNFTNI